MECDTPFSNTLSLSAQQSLLRCLQLSWKLLTGVVSLCNSCEYWHDGPRGDTILPLKRKSVHMGVMIHGNMLFAIVLETANWSCEFM